MSAVAKVIVPNKVWIVEDGGQRLGTLNKEKKGYTFFRKGQKIEIVSKADIKSKLGLALANDHVDKIIKSKDVKDFNVHDYPCSSKPHNPVYNIKKKLPIYSKSLKSKSLYCAGFYVIQFRKGWVKSHCPKLITLERYEYRGPFKTEDEMKVVLAQMSREK